MTHAEIIQSIDEIDAISKESELAVMEAMISDVEKYVVMMENYNGDAEQFESVFQEGDILKRVKKEGKKDSNKLVTVLMFIPRLIRALADIIKRKFEDDKLGDKFKDFGKKLAHSNDKEEKVKKINAEFKGKAECYIDEDGKIKFKKQKGALIEKLMYAVGLAVATDKLFKRIEKEFDYENPSKIRSFVDDVDKLIHGDESVTKKDLFDGGFDAVGDAIKHVTSLTAEFALISAGIEKKADEMRMKNMAKDNENPKLQEALKYTTELTSKMTKLNAIISAALGSVSILTDFGKMLGDWISSMVERSGNIGASLEEAYDAYIDDDLKKEFPKGVIKEKDENGNEIERDETDEEYLKRLRSKVARRKDIKDVIKKQMDIKKQKKQDAKEQEKQRKEDIKNAYKQKKQEMRNKNKKDGDNDDE